NSDFDDRSDQAFGVVVQSLCGPAPLGCDNRITIVGQVVINSVFPGVDHEHFGAERLLENGTLDPSFDGDGKWLDDLGSNSASARAVASQPDGKLVIVGERFTSGNPGFDFAVVRLGLGGSPDSSFDGDGIVITDQGGEEFAKSVAIAPDGKIVVAG